MECLLGVADHLDSQQIAQRLGISPHTVDGHIASAIKALGAMSRRDAIKRLRLQSNHSLTGQIPLVDDPASSPPIPHTVAAGREAPPLTEVATGTETARRDHHGHVEAHPLRIVALIAAIAAALAILLLAMDPLVQNAARLANAINPPRPTK